MLGRIHAAQIRKRVHDDCKRENLAARRDGMDSKENGSGMLAIDVSWGVKRMLHRNIHRNAPTKPRTRETVPSRVRPEDSWKA
jgi:hypothetical protein